MIERQFCAQISKETSEPLIGTATRVDTWLLLEYTGPWGYKAIEDSTLPEEIKEWFARAKKSIPHLRSQFIRQHSRPLKTITCFVVISREERQAIYKFQLKSYEELLELDLQALNDGHARYERFMSQEPLFLVCTHGKHDQCCAKFGMPVYVELVKQAGKNAWQTSHMGGDKFAANLLCLPHGIYYGRVTIPEVQTIVDAYRNNQVYCEKYRGRSAYETVVQAGEHLLRTTQKMYDLDALRFVDLVSVGKNYYKVKFESVKDGVIHCLGVQAEKQEVRNYSACSCKLGSKNSICSYRLRTQNTVDLAMSTKR